jgi:hypothetical protein
LKSHQEAIVLLHQAEAFEKIYREHKDHWLQTFIEAQKRLRAADIWLFNAEFFLARVQNLLIKDGYLQQDQVYEGVKWS